MRALLSVSDKTGIVDFARALVDRGVELVSTGGTYRVLREAGLPAIEVAELTGFPECLDGRVKTLHPYIHAGLLARRDDDAHMQTLTEFGITPIDIVVVNLYPFKQTILRDGVTRAEAVENIDIGGPTMLRAAAKNYQDVAVLTDPTDYGLILRQLIETGSIDIDTKFYLMHKVFMHTAAYDALIADYLRQQRGDQSWPQDLTLTYEKVQEMRYGENPHQRAAFYREVKTGAGAITKAEQLHGKELSFNNINDTNGALELLKEYSEPTVVGCKHGNPCGVGSAATIDEAFQKAFEADRVSIFGGILVANRPVTAVMAQTMKDIFLEVVVAPDYEEEALVVLTQKKNLRLLRLADIEQPQPAEAFDIKKVNGGIIIQTIDAELIPQDQELQVVTETKPTAAQMEDLLFAWKMVKFVKSNGIALAKNKQSIGIGPGQVNRIWATRQCFEHARELIGDEATKGAVLASDAFFPFGDCVEAAHAAGITAIIQPGGSVRDKESIDLCNQYGIAMVFTGMRHFKH